MNVENGEKMFYQYDNIDETFQRFANDQVVSLNKSLNQTKRMLYISLATLTLLISVMVIILIIKLIKRTKSKRTSKREKQIIDSYKK
jgi:lipopolysaccharide/colanic/teichoic acid biosynthesis glycosyltransferase